MIERLLMEYGALPGDIRRDKRVRARARAADDILPRNVREVEICVSQLLARLDPWVSQPSAVGKVSSSSRMMT